LAETRKNDFFWSNEPEPHVQRRREIIQKHPEIKQLIGHDSMQGLATIGLVILQFAVSIFVSRYVSNPFIFFAIVYIAGATINHSLFLAIHEITHNLAFKKTISNNWLALFANLPIVFPYAMSFKIYHAMHHRDQGKDGIDVDIPARPEAKIFRGFVGKFIWAFNQILFYALRPVLVHPIKLNKWQVTNLLTQIVAMAVYIYFVGWIGVLYLLLCDFFAGSLHPMSGHFISEHYVFNEGQETYSYYGPLNKLAFNVGYHNEHHDFPGVPGSRLPKLRKIAPEFYDSLFVHKSWTMVLIKFIGKSSVSLYSRVKRA
jgi:sphingolipid 4-desaturase/C4-monooxygenase